MKRRKLINFAILIIISYIITGCGNKKDKHFYESKGLYDHNLVVKDSLMFVFKDSANYIGQIYDIQFTYNKILISDYNEHLSIFDNRLNFITRIGTRGRGPGEFTFPPEMILGEKNLILINLTDQKYCTYDTNFNFITERDIRSKLRFIPSSALISISGKIISHCYDPSSQQGKNPFLNSNSLFIFNKNFSEIGELFPWKGYFLETRYLAYSYGTSKVLLALGNNGFFASQAGNIDFSLFSSDLKVIKTFGIKPKYFQNPPIEPDVLKTQRSIETAVAFTTKYTYRQKIVYDSLNHYLILSYSNLNKDFFYKRSLLLGHHYIQVYDKNYDCIFDGEVPGLVAFTMNGLVYILTDETDSYIKLYGYEIIKK